MPIKKLKDLEEVVSLVIKMRHMSLGKIYLN